MKIVFIYLGVDAMYSDSSCENHFPLKGPARCPWGAVAVKFPDETACLASFLALEGAEVIAGVKPANLFRIANRQQSCGRNLVQLWQRHGEKLMAGSSLDVKILRATDEALLVLFFDPQLLEKRLRSRGGQIVLQRCGYGRDVALPGVLERLAARVPRNSIPHEIGLFLGYPRKDVEAFLGWRETPATCQRLWKIYGKPRRSLVLADLYANHRAKIASLLMAENDPCSILGREMSLAA